MKSDEQLGIGINEDVILFFYLNIQLINLLILPFV